MRIPFSVYRRSSIWILASAFILLAALFPWGVRVRGSCRWLSLPYLHCMVQPVEIAKIALIIFLAGWIADKKERISDFKRGFLPPVAAAAAMAILVALQPNFSNAFFILFLALAILFVGGCRIMHLVSLGAGVSGAAFLAISQFSHVRGRIDAYLDKAHDLTGINWHGSQSLIAIGSGFITGCGPGRGHQKYSFLPDAHTDFIYSIIGEELGLIGTILVLALFALIFVRAMRTARRAPDSFGYILAMGIGISITAAALANMSMTLGLIPTAGLPLPLVSYGGSSLLTAMASIGILLSISAEGREVVHSPARPRPPRATSGTVYARRVRGRRKVKR